MWFLKVKTTNTRKMAINKVIFLMRDRQNKNLVLSTVNVFFDQSQHISTDGGAYIGGDVNTNGDFIGRDQSENHQT